MKKRGPALLITALIIILVFIVGVRYGQRVEKTNKNVEVLLSLPPTKPVPTQPPVAYETYDGVACGAEFLFPDSLKVDKESSQAANISDGKQHITFACGVTNPFLSLLKDQKVASDEVTLLNRAVPVEIAVDNVYFSLVNSLTGKQVYFAVSKSLLPLLGTSLKFVSPPNLKPSPQPE